ncbi:hypothetical protein ACFL2D_03195, partial [Patescibacteria group bacterium]
SGQPSGTMLNLGAKLGIIDREQIADQVDDRDVRSAVRGFADFAEDAVPTRTNKMFDTSSQPKYEGSTRPAYMQHTQAAGGMTGEIDATADFDEEDLAREATPRRRQAYEPRDPEQEAYLEQLRSRGVSKEPVRRQRTHVPKYNPQVVGISRSVFPLLEEMDGPIAEVAWDYASDPAALWSIYRAKKNVIVSELDACSGSEREVIRSWLYSVELGFRAYFDPQFRRAFENYESARRNLRRTERRLADAEQRNGRDVMRYEEEAFEAYRAFRRSVVMVKNATPDPYASLFAMHRAKGGGDKVVSTWLKIANDLRRSL